MKKVIYIVLAVVLIIAVGTVLYFRFTADEDTWLCKNGQWVKHGTPSVSMPTTGCGDDVMINTNTTAITTFEECAARGNPVRELYPRQCVAGGVTFTEDIGNELEMTDFITVSSPRPNAGVQSPLSVTGEARGTWFFEAQFPIVVYDANGKELASVTAEPQSTWMTDDFVQFAAVLRFPEPDTTTGTLVLKNDNPSGLPENEKQLIIPITFTYSQ